MYSSKVSLGGTWVCLALGSLGSRTNHDAACPSVEFPGPLKMVGTDDTMADTGMGAAQELVVTFLLTGHNLIDDHGALARNGFLHRGTAGFADDEQSRGPRRFGNSDAGEHLGLGRESGPTGRPAKAHQSVAPENDELRQRRSPEQPRDKAP